MRRALIATAVMSVATLGLFSTASAQDVSVTTTPKGMNVVFDLPFTGGNVLPGLAIGASLIVAGGLLLLSLKRRRSAA